MKTEMIRGAAIGLALLIGSSANAGLIRITPDGVAVADQTVTDPVNLYDGDGFRLTYHGGGSDAFLNPVTLIIGTTENVAPSIDALLTASNPADLDVVITGPSGPTSWTGTPDDVYSLLNAGAPLDYDPYPGGDSANWTNLATIAPDLYGLDPVSEYFVWTFTLDFRVPDGEGGWDPYMLDRGDWIEFNSELALGSFVVGWGCTTRDPETLDCTSGDATPFTFTGYVPEPGALLLMGSGLLLVGFSGRRRRIPS